MARGKNSAIRAIEIAFSTGMPLGGGHDRCMGEFRNRIFPMLFTAFIMALCTVVLGVYQEYSGYSSLFSYRLVCLSLYRLQKSHVLNGFSC